MTRALSAMLALTLCAASLGCFRTRYTNLTPYVPPRQAALPHRQIAMPPYRQTALPPRAAVKASSWQSFYVYGWSPEELVIDAARICGDAAQVDSIETRQSFVQGLIAAVAGYYINIYSPYTGAVNCKESRDRR